MFRQIITIIIEDLLKFHDTLRHLVTALTTIHVLITQMPLMRHELHVPQICDFIM
jgi:hypothetical protein